MSHANWNRGIRRVVWMAATVAALAATACGDDYEPLIICHNANCLEPANPEDDSTLETLEASMALFDEERGTPPFDGLEIDTFWWGDEERCLMAHDLDHPERAVDAVEAVEAVHEALSDRMSRGEAITRSGEHFTLLIELKGHVEPPKEAHHNPEQRRQHAECAVEMAQLFMDGADDAGYSAEVVFMSFAPPLLKALSEVEGFDALRQRQQGVRLSALHGLPRPLDIQTEPLDAFPDDIGIDLISAHPHWTRDIDIQAYESRGFELNLWSFNLVPEHYDAIRIWRPIYVTTSQAPTLSAWLDQKAR